MPFEDPKKGTENPEGETKGKEYPIDEETGQVLTPKEAEERKQKIKDDPEGWREQK